MRGDSTSYTIRERLILAGIEEIRLHGLQDFSLRKAASACGVSCACLLYTSEMRLGPVLGIHLGDSAIGVAWLEKETKE